MTWQDVAPCRGLTRLFFAPEHENLKQRRLRLAEARAVCRGCEFGAECAAQGAGEPFGVWAGVPHDTRQGAVAEWRPRLAVAR